MSREIEILRLCLLTPRTLPAVVVGAPGIGKTDKIRKLAESMGWPSYYFTPGTHGEGMSGVVPVPMEDGMLHFPPPACLVEMFPKDCKGGLFFIDEINTCTPACMPALLGLLLEGRIGDYRLPPQVRRIAAMNPVNQAAGGWDLPPAIANRMQYYRWTAPNAQEWAEWLLDQAHPQEGRGWIQARSMAAAFHRKNPGKLMEDPDKVLPERSSQGMPAYATPRSWETAVRMHATCIDRGNMEDYPLIVEGVLGKPVGIEYATWLRKNDLPDPEDLLADPTSWKPDAKESDKVFAACFAVAETACLEQDHQGKKFGKKDRSERWNSAWLVLNQAIPLGKGMVVIAARKLARPENRPDGGLLDATVRKIITSLKDVVSAAGLV